MQIQTFKGMPIWGAARPTPGAFLITSTISSITFWILSDPISSGGTSRAGSWRTGSPAFTVSGWIFFFSPKPRSQPARALAEELWLVLVVKPKSKACLKMGFRVWRKPATGWVRNGVGLMGFKHFPVMGMGRRRWVNRWMLSIICYVLLCPKLGTGGAVVQPCRFYCPFWCEQLEFNLN